MRLISLFCIMCISLAACTQADAPSDTAETADLQALGTGTLKDLVVFDTPRPLPDVKLARPDQAPQLAAAQIEGPALINLWATWCGPCVKELPSLGRLSVDTGLPVYAVSIDRGKSEKVTTFLNEKGGQALILLRNPDASFPQSLELGVLPVTVLVNGDGEMVGQLLGEADWDAREAQRLARALMKG